LSPIHVSLNASHQEQPERQVSHRMVFWWGCIQLVTAYLLGACIGVF
jgi:hypothetical protein